MSDDAGISESQLIEFRQTKPNILLIDLRKKEDFAKGHIKGSNILALDEEKILNIPEHTPIILISYEEKQSKIMANTLREKNFETYYLVGGLRNWSRGLYCTNISYVGTNYP